MISKNPIEDAMHTLKKAIEKDSGYKIAWVANIACKIIDNNPSIDHNDANSTADKIVNYLFEIK